MNAKYTSIELARKMNEVHRLSHRAAAAQRDPLTDPSRGQGRVLHVLKITGDVTTRDLAFLMQVRPQSMNELLAKLESSGYIERVQNDEDRRSVLVRLTEKGEEAVQRPESRVSQIYDVLEDEEKDTFGGYLDRIIDGIRQKYPKEEREAGSWEEEARHRLGDERFERFMDDERMPRRPGRECGRHGMHDEDGECRRKPSRRDPRDTPHFGGRRRMCRNDEEEVFLAERPEDE